MHSVSANMKKIICNGGVESIHFLPIFTSKERSNVTSTTTCFKGQQYSWSLI